MTTYIYIADAGDSYLARFTLDPARGTLTRRTDIPVSGGPGYLTADPGRKFLYASTHSPRELISFAIAPATGDLTRIGAVRLDADPCYLSTDQQGRFLLAAYYAAGKVTVHPIDDQGVVHGPPCEDRPTLRCAHFIETDPSNRFAFVPHVAESNTIFQFLFDENTGRLTPNAVPRVDAQPGQGPRHFVFHPSKDLLYACNEQQSSVTAYHFNGQAGTLAPFQTVSTLDGAFSGSNSNAQIRIHPHGTSLYASNRGHDSIACFALDVETGRLTSLGQVPGERVPRAFNIDPDGHSLFAGGEASGKLVVYHIDARGRLQPQHTYEIGQTVSWVLPVKVV